MPTWVLIVGDVAVGIALCAAGLVILVRRRERRVGALLLATSATWFAGSLWAPLVFLHRGPMVHLHLSYPTGRLRRWAAVAATLIAYGWAIAEGWISEPAVTAVLALVMAAAATEGYLHTSGPARRAGRPGFAAALLFAGILGLSAANQLLGLRADTVVALAYDVVMVFVAVWLTVDLLHGRWTEATLADLVTQLGEHPDGVGGEGDLRRALGDPGLVIGYWDAAAGRYFDAGHRPVDITGDGTTLVDDDRGRPLALLRHDPAILDDPVLLEGASGALRLLATNARLRSEIQGRVDELATARKRIIEAADEQHRALQAELASGPQARLAAALTALSGAEEELADDKRQLVAGIEDARAELTRFAQGLRPAALESAGLRVALERIAERSGLAVELRIDVDRLTRPLESAVWFVCAEAFTNAAKHAQATKVTLEIARRDGGVAVDVLDDGVGGADPSGAGLRGLADRIAAFGGSLTVTDGTSGGTLVSARIPRGGAV